VERWGAQEGFPEETVFAITQTSDGYLWIATPAGLLRFDGREFVFHDRYRVSGEPPLRIADLAAAKNGMLWVRSAEGLLWRHSQGRFVKVSGTEGRPLGRVRWIGIDADDRLWIATQSGMHTWKHGEFQWNVMNLSRWQEVGTSYFLDRDRRLWVRPGTSSGLYRLNSSGEPDLSVATDAPVQSMVQDAEGRLYCATKSGLYRVDGDHAVDVDGTQGRISGSYVRLRLERDGAIWVSSREGLSRYRKGRLEGIARAEDLGDQMRALFLDREGSLWMGAMRKGLFRVQEARFAAMGAAEGLSSDQVYAVYRDRAGTLWVGTDRGLDAVSPQGIVHYGEAQGVFFGDVRAITEDGRGRIWIGGDNGLAVQDGQRFVEQRLGGKAPSTRGMTTSRGGGVWVATAEAIYEAGKGEPRVLAIPEGLETRTIRFLYDSRTFGLLAAPVAGGLWSCSGEKCVQLTPAAGKGNLTVYEAIEDASGTLWAATSRGVGRMRKVPGTFPQTDWYNVDQWLTPKETEFYQVEEARDGRLWVGGRRSLVRMDKVEPEQLTAGHLRQFDLQDGLRSANFGVARQGYRQAAAVDQFWLPTMVGLVGVVPQEIRENPLPPLVAIERIVVDGQEVDPWKPVLLRAGSERVEIRFSGLSLRVPAKVRYRYKLEGFDPEWVESGTVNRAVYTRLGKGDYRFRVLACNNDGVWNEDGASLSFEIEPHLYERWWFLTGAGALTLLAGWLIHRARMRALVARAASLEERVQERTAQLERSRREAEEAARAKADFLATMSHEIRTPMNGVLGMVSLLENTSLTSEQRECTEIISGSGQALLAIINDVLSLSQIEAGKLELTLGSMNLRRLCEQVIRLFQQTADTKGLDLDLTLDETLPEWYSADEARVRQVLVNLVGNAVKFTERGSVKLTVAGRPAEQNRYTLTFSIRDTGIGVAAEQLPRLFRKFTQADSSAARKYGGTGLGLAISRRLADLMNGSIDAESTPGVGSTFRFLVTLETVAAPAAQNGHPRVFLKAVQPMRILLAEDNPVNVKVAVGLLTRLGYSSHVAANGKEVLAAMEKEPFDIVFMDCQMPELDGFEATRQIRERLGDQRPVIIAMTANAMEGDRERCLHSGMDDYLAKPLVLSDLADCLERWTRAGVRHE
jgi:signal transduction histidine kinase/ligand-binding sensor domain-containing protein/CheY-like chemotaxis protein